MTAPADGRAALRAPDRAASVPNRIGGVDVARGVALLAMFASHVGPDPGDGGVASPLAIAPGRSQALFILLAGVSIALLSGGRNPARGQAGQRAATRIAVRAVLLIPLGLLLTALGSSIYVILTYYALFFLLALPALRLRTGSLVALTAVLAVFGPLVSFVLRARFFPVGWSPEPNPGVPDFGNFASLHGLAILFLVGAFPAFTAMPFVFAGMAIGRLDLRRPGIPARLLAVGSALTLVGYGGSRLALHLLGGMNHILASVPTQDRAFASGQLFDGVEGFVPTTSPAWLLTSANYSGTTFWLAGAGGVALMVLGGCLLLTKGGVRGPLLGQLANLGAMVLSAYSLQIVLAAVFENFLNVEAGWLELAVISGSTVLLAAMWRRRVSRRGPLETWLHVWSTRAAQAVAPSGARRPPEQPMASGSPPGPAPGDPAPVPVTGPQS